MKRGLVLILILHLSKWMQAQLPFTYQFVLPQWNKTDSIDVKVQLLPSINATVPLYEEINRTLPSPMNIVVLDVGSGTPTIGNYNSLNWAEGEKYIRVYYKLPTTSNYNLHITEQLLSVPYAMYALRSGTPPIQGDKGEPGDSGVIITDIKVLEDTLTISLSDNRVFHFGGMRGEKGKDGKIPMSFSHQNDSLYVLFNDSTIINAGRSRGDTGEAGKPAPLGGYDLYIGQYYQGGIIFHLWHDNDSVHGLVVSLQDLCSSCKWMDRDTNATVDSANTIDGRKNSAYILAQTWINESAAKVCDTFSFAGYDDWYLPSLEEWRLLIFNMIPVNRALSRITSSHSLTRPFKCYWTSNFENIMIASYVEPNTIDRARLFYGGVIYTNSLLSVRAIRRF
jgi:hypothetical protein